MRIKVSFSIILSAMLVVALMLGLFILQVVPTASPVGIGLRSRMVYLAQQHAWMEFSEALDAAHHIWQEVWGSDVEEVYLEEMKEYAEGESR